MPDLMVMLWIVVLGTAIVRICRVKGQESPQPQAAGEPPLTEPAVQASSHFALDFYHHLAQEQAGKNVFFSPYSIFSALMMTAEGARGETARQMATVLQCLDPVRQTEAPPSSVSPPAAPLRASLALLHHRLMSKPEATQRPAAKEKVTQLEQEHRMLSEQLAQLQSEQERLHAEPSRGEHSQRLSTVLDARLALSHRVLTVLNELKTLRDQVDPYELQIANALWGEQTFPFRPQFVETLTRDYAAAALPVDFRQQPEQARTRINQWIGQQTHERIAALLAPGSVSSDTRLVLANAIYFKGSWAEPFAPERTQEADFTLQDGTKTVAKFMAAPQLRARYAELRPDGTRLDPMFHRQGFTYHLAANPDGLQVLALPYRGHTMTMLLLLPRQPEGLSALQRQLSPETVSRWLAALQEQPVQVFLPRFTLRATYRLPAILSTMGMPAAFQPGGLTGLSDAAEAQHIFLSDIIHGAFVEVTEEGTEASGVTVILGIRRVSLEIRPPTPIFRADRPFVFLIREEQTGTILFMGRIMRPEDTPAQGEDL